MNLEDFIKSAGYLGLFGIVFAESGLFFGFFFPGDSLLFTAGFLASQGFFDIKILIPLLILAAIAGDSTGYWFGKKTGKRIFSREDSILFHKDHLIKANEFYKKHGGKTIILARFMPAVRTFAPIVAGAAEMHYTTFLFYNVIGGLLWVLGLGLGGYYLGQTIPDVDKYIIPIVLLIIFVSLLPAFIHLFKEKESRTKLMSLISTQIKKVLKKS